MPVSAEGHQEATPLSDMPVEIIAKALQRMAADPAERTPNPSSVWIDPAAHRAIEALSDAGFDIVKRPHGPDSSS